MKRGRAATQARLRNSSCENSHPECLIIEVSLVKANNVVMPTRSQDINLDHEILHLRFVGNGDFLESRELAGISVFSLLCQRQQPHLAQTAFLDTPITQNPPITFSRGTTRNGVDVCTFH